MVRATPEESVTSQLLAALGRAIDTFYGGRERYTAAYLLAAHEAAFAHFGGRCEFLLYDRMRTVDLLPKEARDAAWPCRRHTSIRQSSSGSGWMRSSRRRCTVPMGEAGASVA